MFGLLMVTKATVTSAHEPSGASGRPYRMKRLRWLDGMLVHLKFIFSVERCEHAVPLCLFIHAHILPLDFLYFKSVCCLMHDIRNQVFMNAEIAGEKFW